MAKQLDMYQAFFVYEIFEQFLKKVPRTNKYIVDREVSLGKEREVIGFYGDDTEMGWKKIEKEYEQRATKRSRLKIRRIRTESKRFLGKTRFPE